MKALSTLATAGPAFGLAFLLATSSVATAQTFYGFAGGPEVRGNGGYAAQASLGRQLARHLALRLDVTTSRFGAPEIFSAVAQCIACGAGAPPPNGSVGVVAVLANGLVNITAPADTVGLYLIAGAGAYYFYQDPSAQGAVRPGVSAGAGLALRVGTHSQLFIEARYHDVLGAASSVTWLAPVTLGLRF